MTVKGFLSGLTSIIQGRLASVREAAEADAALVADAYMDSKMHSPPGSPGRSRS